MIKNEWSAIIKNKFLWLVMLALVLIPSLYNIIFLSSMWDPYGRLSDLPVAVVDQDRATSLNGKRLDLGASIVSEMKTSKGLDYHFVSSDTASKGLKSGDYYMIITLPANLSQNAATLMDAAPKKVTIDYQTSKGHNFISSKMSDSAMASLNASVSQQITQNYTKAILDNLSSLKSGLSIAASGSTQLTNGLHQTQNGSATLSSNLTALASSTLIFSDGTQSLSNGLTTYLSNLTAASTAAQKLQSGSSNLTNATQQLSQGLTQLSQATTLTSDQQSQLTQLSNGLTTLNQAIQTGNTNASNLTDTLTSLADAVQSLSNSGQAQATAVEATKAYQSLGPDAQQELLAALESPAETQALTQIQSALQTLTQTLTAMQTAQTQLQTASAQILPAASTQLTTLTAGLTATHAALANQMTPGLTQLSQGQNQLTTGLTTLSQGTSQLQVVGTQQLSPASWQLATGAQQLLPATQQLATGGNQLTTALSQLTKGTQHLTTSLQTAANQLTAQNTSPENATTLASPLALAHTDTDNTPTNGVGMAPYMISVALFVGALSTNVILGRAITDEKKARSGWDFLLTKLSTNGVIALLQGLLVSGAVVLLGLRASHPVLLILGSMLTAFLFMSMVTFFNLWLGKVGAFLMLLLLMVQLATAAGTYPIQLEAPIFQTLNPWLPMTYTVRLFRQAISLTGNIGSYLLILIPLALIFTLLIPIGHRKPLVTL
ncbi:MAG: YhgE/Pip domain-containing protein [Streptococcaceae bacterium]|nr:YhgE/Pip domain-containing protein [Streptococcaceae bacterium]